MAIINYSDLIADDGAFDDAIKKIDELEKKLKDVVKTKRQRVKVVSPEDVEGVKELAKEITKLKKENENLKKSREQVVKQKKKITELNKAELIQLEKEREAKRKARQEAKAIAKVQASTVGSIEEMRAKLTLVTLAWGKLSEAERENSTRGRRLVASKKALTDELKDLEKQTGDNRRNVGNYSEAVLEGVRALRKQQTEVKTGIADLKKQKDTVKKGSAEWVQYGKAIDTAEKKLENINSELGETRADGNGAEFDFSSIGDLLPDVGGIDLGGILGGTGGGLGSILSMINPITAGIGLAVAGITAFGTHVLELEARFTKLRGEIQKTTGAIGYELDALTENTITLGTVFGDDEGALIRSQNVLMKKFGKTAEEAFSVLESGYLSGANAQGDLLDNINEYSDQILDAGGNAEDLVRILDKANKNGVFSDKGVDAVKEFNLRIKEQTKPTKDALTKAYGKEFANTVFKGISEGSITSLEALEMVSQKMNDTKIPAEQLQTVVADLFGGAGEDAGMTFLKSLKDITQETDSLIDVTNPLVKEQRQQLRLQKELARSEQELAKEFTGLGNALDSVGTSSKAFINDVLTQGVKKYKALGQSFKGIYTSLFDLDVDGFTGNLKKYASSIFSIASPALAHWTKDVFKLTEAEETSIEVSKLRNEVTEVASANIAEQSEKYNNLITAINDNNISQKDRLKLLDKINKLNPTILKDLVDKEGKITDVTLARKRLGMAIVENIYAQTKELLLAQKIQEFTDTTLARIELQRKAKKEGVWTKYIAGIVTTTDTERLDEANEKLRSLKIQIKELNNGSLDRALRDDLLEIANAFKGDGASIFGDNLDTQKEDINRITTEVKKLQVEIDRESDPKILKALKAKLDRYEQELTGANSTFKKTSQRYKKLLGLIDEAKKGTGAGGGTSDDPTSKGGKSVPELDLLEKIRARRNEINNEGLKKALESLNIRIDKELKGFEKLRKETAKLRKEGLISVKDFERRIGEINTISDLATKERYKKVGELEAKFLTSEQKKKLNQFKEELKIRLNAKAYELKKAGRAEELIQDEIKSIKLKAIKEQISLLEKADAERVAKVQALKLKQINTGLTDEEKERLKALEGIKSNEAEILALKLKSTEETIKEADRRKLDSINLKGSKRQGKVIGINSEIETLKNTKNGDKVTEAELLQVKDLIKQRYELQKAGLEEEYALKLSKLKEGSDKYKKVEQDRLNALKKLELNHAKEIGDLNGEIRAKETEGWKNFTDELGQVFSMVLDKLQDIYNKSVEKSEERLEKQNDAVDRQRDRAEKGLSNTLAFEEKEMAKREAELVRANKRLERIQKVKALYSMYTANAGKGDGKGALAKTLKDFAILEAITKGFKKGGYTGDGGVNEVAGVTHGKEFVIDANETAKLGLRGKTMSEFKDLISDPLLRSSNSVGLSVEVLKSQKSNFIKGATPVVKETDTSGIEQEIRELKEYEMSKPIQTTDFKKLIDGTLEFIEETHTKNKTVRNRHRLTRKKKF